MLPALSQVADTLSQSRTVPLLRIHHRCVGLHVVAIMLRGFIVLLAAYTEKQSFLQPLAVLCSLSKAHT
jgi:multisubunit Na+/H+ antiporter MnhF subunit